MPICFSLLKPSSHGGGEVFGSKTHMLNTLLKPHKYTCSDSKIECVKIRQCQHVSAYLYLLSNCL